MEWLTDLEEARAEATRTGRPAFVLATVTWCPWCVKLDNETLAQPQVQAALAGLVCARLNGDDHENLPYDYDFDVYPTGLVFGVDGALRGTIEGFHEPGEFLDQLVELTSA